MRINEFMNSVVASLVPANLEGVSVADFIQRECPIAANSHPVYRGTRRGIQGDLASKIFFADSSQITRKSSYTFNFYTLLMDEIVPAWGQAGYPKRSKSFICGSSERTCSSRGPIFQVFPIKDTVVGVCPGADIWNSFKTISNLSYINSMFHGLAKVCKLPTHDSLINANRIIEATDRLWFTDSSWRTIQAECGRRNGLNLEAADYESFTDFLNAVMDPVANGFTLQKLSELDTTSSRELWLSGPAYFVHVRNRK